MYNLRQNELRQFAQNWAFLRFTDFKRRKESLIFLPQPLHVPLEIVYRAIIQILTATDAKCVKGVASESFREGMVK